MSKSFDSTTPYTSILPPSTSSLTPYYIYLQITLNPFSPKTIKNSHLQKPKFSTSKNHLHHPPASLH